MLVTSGRSTRRSATANPGTGESETKCSPWGVGAELTQRTYPLSGGEPPEIRCSTPRLVIVTTPPESSSTRPSKGSFGPNAWLVDDMYDRFLADPNSVAESWREFFADYRPGSVPAPTQQTAPAP